MHAFARTPVVAALIAAAVLFTADAASAQSLFRRLMPVKRVEANAEVEYTVGQKNGPWHVMACTFSGEGAEQQARDLALEFRSRFNLPAYVHNMQFKLDDEGDVGRGVDKYGAPVKMRYRRGSEVEEWAVLVGDFESVDDPKAQDVLKSVKTLHPDALDPQKRGGQSNQTLGRVRAMQVAFVERLRNQKELGPMRTAFMTRNPVLPDEYFVPKGVDAFIEKMNRGVKHSLLDNPKKYTIRVATFKGKGVLQGARNAPELDSRDSDALDPLAEAALNAHELTEALRAAKWQAWEFHDRNESYVTIGGYDQPMERGLDGGEVPNAEVMQIVRTFGAAFDTPSDPLQRERLPIDVQQHVRQEAQQRFQQFNARFAQHGQVAGGLKPKFARVPHDSKQARVVPFDVYPEVIEVPKKSISAGFAVFR